MPTRPLLRFRFDKLQLLVIAAIVVLLCQTFPSFLNFLASVVNIRRWTRTGWFAANTVVVVALLLVRFGPDLIASWRARHKIIVIERAKLKKKQAIKERREVIERIQRGRQSRIS